MSEKIWEKIIDISTCNSRLAEDNKKCIVKDLEGKRCRKNNGYGDSELFCKQHSKTKVDTDNSGDCFYDLAPRYRD